MTEHNEHTSHEHHKTHAHHNSSKKKIKKSVIWQGISAILIVLLLITGYKAFMTDDSSTSAVVTKEVAGEKALEFINDNLVEPGTKATLKEVTEENGMYKLDLNIKGQEISSYMSKDGKVFFPSAMDIAEIESQAQASEEQQEQEAADVPKTDKPVVEMFIMSHCPYGTQIQKGMIPVMETLKDKADIQVKFVDYAMHGQKELDEQLNQYCIQENYENKYIDYMKCFLADGEGDACIKEVGIDSEALASCALKADKEFNVSANFEDEEKLNWRGSFPPFYVHAQENKKYGVRGSPTLVINGQTVSSARDSASLLSAVCNAFTTAPSECDTELSSASPAPGFGFDATAASATAATCG